MPSLWKRYWFRETTAEELGLHRAVLYSILFAVYLFQDYSSWANVSSAFWMPISIFRLLPGPPRNVLLIAILQTIWKASLVAAALGFLTRWSTAIAAALGCFLLGLPNCFGKIHHLDAFPVLLLIIFALSRCGEGLSIDKALWRSRRPRNQTDADFAWPVQLGQVLFLLLFASAGIAKLWHSGPAWVTAENMRNIMIGNAFLHHPPTRLADWIAASPLLCRWTAAAAISIELAALPAIFLPRFRPTIVLALLGLQTGIALSMGIYFVPHLAGYALFAPWRKLLAKSGLLSFEDGPTREVRI